MWALECCALEYGLLYKDVNLLTAKCFTSGFRSRKIVVNMLNVHNMTKLVNKINSFYESQYIKNINYIYT